MALRNTVTHRPLRKVRIRQHREAIHVTMSNVTSTTAPLSVKPSTLRVRRHRQRRREGLCSFSIEMSKADIEDAIARGILKADYDAWDVLDSWYADHLSDTALEWLIDNKIITREQSNDAVAILRSISDWVERLDDVENTNKGKGT